MNTVKNRAESEEKVNRTQAAENLKSFGVEEPTEEQITEYLNQVHGESKKEKDRADRLKEQADRVKGLEDQLKELNNANLSDIEKANKERDDALGQIDSLKTEIENMKLKNELASIGISGEDADNLVVDGKLNSELLGKIISARETAAASAKEQEILKETPNPAGVGGKGENEKPVDVANAEKLSFGTGIDEKNKDYYMVH